MKEIIFSPIDEKRSAWLFDPEPAINNLPNWYKDSRQYIEKNNKPISKNGSPLLTVKRCVPFLDAMSSGYFIFLSADIFVSQESNGYCSVSWFIQEEMITEHTREQLANFSVPNNFSKDSFKWTNFHHISTPKGYSCLITHPMNRNDLPFLTLSGVVDTDKHNVAINFPFFIKRDFQGTIFRGTPIAQIIPFKRDNWKWKRGNPINDHPHRFNFLRSTMENSYKKLFWTRKNYR